jgi:hypothetical protein
MTEQNPEELKARIARNREQALSRLRNKKEIDRKSTTLDFLDRGNDPFTAGGFTFDSGSSAFVEELPVTRRTDKRLRITQVDQSQDAPQCCEMCGSQDSLLKQLAVSFSAAGTLVSLNVEVG